MVKSNWALLVVGAIVILLCRPSSFCFWPWAGCERHWTIKGLVNNILILFRYSSACLLSLALSKCSEPCEYSSITLWITNCEIWSRRIFISNSFTFSSKSSGSVDRWRSELNIVFLLGLYSITMGLDLASFLNDTRFFDDWSTNYCTASICLVYEELCSLFLLVYTSFTSGVSASSNFSSGCGFVIKTDFRCRRT